MSELPVAPIGSILKNVGAQRISNEAKVELAEVLDVLGLILHENLLILHAILVVKLLKPKILN